MCLSCQPLKANAAWLSPVFRDSAISTAVSSLPVSPEQVKVYAHKELLSESSVLERRCSNGFRDSGTRHIDLPEDDPL